MQFTGRNNYTCNRPPNAVYFAHAVMSAVDLITLTGIL